MTISDLLQPRIVLDVDPTTLDVEISHDDLVRIHTGLSLILRRFPNCEIVIKNTAQ